MSGRGLLDRLSDRSVRDLGADTGMQRRKPIGADRLLHHITPGLVPRMRG